MFAREMKPVKNEKQVAKVQQKFWKRVTSPRGIRKIILSKWMMREDENERYGVHDAIKDVIEWRKKLDANAEELRILRPEASKTEEGRMEIERLEHGIAEQKGHCDRLEKFLEIVRRATRTPEELKKITRELGEEDDIEAHRKKLDAMQEQLLTLTSETEKTEEGRMKIERLEQEIAEQKRHCEILEYILKRRKRFLSDFSELKARLCYRRAQHLEKEIAALRCEAELLEAWGEWRKTM